MANKPWHRGDYAARARKVRDAAYADPATRCWRCSRTLDQHKPGDTWTAGHVIDGDPASPLLPEARSCNCSAGASMGNRRRTAPRVSPIWR